MLYARCQIYVNRTRVILFIYYVHANIMGLFTRVRLGTGVHLCKLVFMLSLGAVEPNLVWNQKNLKSGFSIGKILQIMFKKFLF